VIHRCCLIASPAGAANINSIMCCRSLTYHIDHIWDWAIYPPFPENAKMAGLTRLYVACHDAKAVSLESLHNLKDFTYKNSALLKEVVISSAAELTKLSLQCRLRLVRSRQSCEAFSGHNHTQIASLTDCPCSEKEYAGYSDCLIC